MTITNGYCSLAEFKAYVTSPGSTISTDSGDDAVMEQIVEGASRYIDDQTLRTFYARTETHYYSVPDGETLWIDDDDLLSLTTLTNGDGTVIASTYYTLLPLNKARKFAVMLKASSPYFWSADASGEVVGVITIAGSWGWSSTTPTDVKNACLQIAKGVYNRRFGENVSSDSVVTAGGLVITPKDVPAMAQRIIDAHKRHL